MFYYDKIVLLDELIRQVTINCAERGLLLLRCGHHTYNECSAIITTVGFVMK